MTTPPSVAIFNDMANGFFAGRNGSDALSVFLTAAALVTAVAASVIISDTARSIVSVIAIILVAVAAWRMLSRNTAKRRMENERFLSFFRALKGDSERARRKAEEKEERKRRKEDGKTHAYFRCPECRKDLRVPRGKGKIRITCPHCGHQFIKKT